MTDHLRFHRKHEHLAATFGASAFGRIAEQFARSLGTPVTSLARPRSS